MTKTERREAIGAPLSTVVVATDFSPIARRAVLRAVRLRLARRAHLLLVHVLPEGLPRKARSAVAREVKARLHEEAEAARGAADELGRSDLVIRTEVGEGPPAREIVRRARLAASELILLGRHGRRRIRDMFLGSTAERVLRRGEVPVLIVTKSPIRPYTRPLVALDTNETAALVLRTALRTVAHGPTVGIVHAYDSPYDGLVYPALERKTLLHLRRENRARASRSLAEILRAFEDLDVSFETHLRLGSARVVVPEVASRYKADVLVLGTHGRSALSQFFLGSTASSLLRDVNGDVLVTSPEPPANALR